MTRTPSTRSAKFRIAGVCAAGALLLAGGGYALTGAAFTDQQTVTGNKVTAASLTIGDTVRTQVTPSTTGLLPGEWADPQTVLTFKNSGSVPFQYEVTTTNAAATDGPAELLGWIPVTISNGTVSETGTLAAPPTLKVGSTAVGATGTISVTVGLDAKADNSAQRKSATFDVVVTASQVAAN